MKRYVWLALVIAILVPVAAFACHNAIAVDVSKCGEAKITGTFYGDARYAKVVVYVDGVFKGEAIEYRLLGNATASKTVTVTSGSVATVKGYTKANILSPWVLKADTSQSFTIQSCYVTCSKTVPTDPEEGWSDWTWDPVAQDEVRTRPLFDAVDPKHSCGTQEQFKKYQECSKVNEVVLNGHIEYRDVNTGKLCESRCRDRWVQQSYGLFALEGPNGEYATMYVYADENGKLPIGVSVQRQQCVLGWVAVNTPYAGWVYKNPCTGEYKWNDQTFQPRRDVIKHGVCDRSQPCIVE